MKIDFMGEDYSEIIDRSKKQPRGYYPTYKFEDFDQWERGWEMMDGFPWMRDPNMTDDEERIARMIGGRFLDIMGSDQFQIILPIYNEVSDLMAMQPDLVLLRLPIADKACYLPHAELVLHFQWDEPLEGGTDPRPGVYAALEVPFYVAINPIAKKITIRQLEKGEWQIKAKGRVDEFTFKIDGRKIHFDFKSMWDDPK
jgi:hypothetical protein